MSTTRESNWSTDQATADDMHVGLTKMEYAVIHSGFISLPPAAFVEKALKMHPKWNEIKADNPTAKADGPIMSIFKNKYPVEFLACNIKAEQYWRLYYLEELEQNMYDWNKEVESGEETPLYEMFKDAFEK